MNTNWRNRPTSIDTIKRDQVHHLVFVDESGFSNLEPAVMAKQAGVGLGDNERYITITAVMFDMSSINDAQDAIMHLKMKYWQDGLYKYKDGPKRVIFHSRDIRNRQGPFDPHTIDYKSFVEELSMTIEGLPMTIYAAHIDKLELVTRYYYPKSPYDLGMNFILERIMKDIKTDEKVVLVLESRNKDDDKTLLKQLLHMLDHGNNYHAASFFSQIKGVYFNRKWCKKDHNQTSYWELELADLCAYPIRKYCIYGRKDQAYQSLESKIACFPYYQGKGLKVFP